MIFFGEKIEEDFTVNEMIGVLKWIRLVDGYQEDCYLDMLTEWQELGSGDTTVADCRRVYANDECNN